MVQRMMQRIIKIWRRYPPKHRQESGAALLIITTIASMVMVGYAMYSSSDASMLLRRQQDHVATYLAQSMFALVSSTITQSETMLCGEQFDDFITVGDDAIDPGTLSLNWEQIKGCAELTSLFEGRGFPQHLVQAAEFQLDMVSEPSQEHKNLTARLEASIIVTVRSPGAAAQRERTTKHVATFKVAVLRYANFGLILHGDQPLITLDGETQSQLKVASPTLLVPFSPLSLGNLFNSLDRRSSTEFMQPVYSTQPLTDLSGLTQEEFRATYQKGLITNFAGELSESPLAISASSPDSWSLGEHYRCWMDDESSFDACKNIAITTPDLGQGGINNICRSGQAELSGYLEVSYDDGQWFCRPVSQENNPYPLNGTLPESSPQGQTDSYHLEFSFAERAAQLRGERMWHNCNTGSAQNVDMHNKSHYHPYISLFEPDDLAITLSNQWVGQNGNRQYGPIFCGIIFAQDLTININADRSGDFIFFGIIAANNLVINFTESAADATLYLINPVAVSSHALRLRSAVEDSSEPVLLSQYLKELSTSISAIRALQDIWGTTILRNIYLPLLRSDRVDWQNRVLPAQDFLDNDLDADRVQSSESFTIQAPDRRDASNLYEAYEAVESEDAYAAFGDPDNQPVYVVTMDDRQMEVCDPDQAPDDC